MGSQDYTIHKEYIDSDLTWFPVTMPLTTTQAPTGFWSSLNQLSADDDFTGVDGNAPDSNKWTPDDASIQIQSNSLEDTVDDEEDFCTSKFTLINNFDIRVDFDLSVAPFTDKWEHHLLVRKPSDDDEQIRMGRRYQSSDGNRYFLSRYDGGNFNTEASVVTADTTGKYRISRVDNLFTVYYYSAGWQEIGSGYTHNNIGSEVEVRFRWRSAGTGTPTFTADFDNFTINGADKILWDNYANRVYFTDTDDNKLYTEIETFNHATSAATYHTAVPTVTAETDTPLTLNWDWEGRDYSVRALPAADYNYAFTGTNGSQPDPAYFTANPTAPATVEIQSNKLNVYIASGVGNPADATYVPKLYGNFDVQVDYDLTTFPNSSYWGIMLSVTDSNGAGADMIRGRYNYHAYRTYLAGWQTQTSTGDSSGKLRITRVGNTWTTYFWGGSSWTQNYTTTVATNPGEITVKLLLRYGDTLPEVEANWDNFIVNSIEYNSDEVNDDFTGSDGDAPDPLKWRQAGNIITNIQSNTLEWDSNESTDQNEYNIYRAKFPDDFDIQIDFEILNETTPGSSLHYAIFQLITSANDGYIARAKNNSGNAEYIYSGFGDSWTSHITTDNTGKLRFKRVNGTITVYHWNAGSTQWEWNGNVAGHVFATNDTNDVEVRLWTKQEANARWNGNWDNFQINGADSITGWTDNTGNLPAQTVWDSNFKIVTHLADTPTGSADDIKDSTANEYHGKSINMDSGNSGSNDFGKYLTFDGSNEYIQFGDAFYSNELTIESVSNVTSFTGGQPRMVWTKRNTAGTTSTDSSNSEWASQYIDADTMNFQAWEQPGSDIVASDGRNSSTNLTGVETYMAGVIPVAASGSCNTHINGEHGLGALRKSADIHNGPLGIQLGSRSNNNNSRWFLGNMREARLSNTARSKAWVKATNLSLMGGLFDEPTIAGSSGSEVYTIEKDRIDEELTWFPTTLSMDFTGSPAPSADFWDYFTNEGLNNVNDAFTGNNGNEPDTNKWTLVPNSNDGIIEINSNQLLTRHNENDTGDHYAVSNFRLSGNFDIQVDFDLEDYTADDDWVGYLRINAENGSFAYVGKGYMSASRRYRFRYYDIGGVNSQTDVTGDPTETTGKYRLRRSGSTLTGYYWNSPDWQEIDSQTYHTNDVEVRLGIYKSFNIGGSTIDHSFDNFTVSYADNIKWTYGDRLYLEDNDSNRLYAEIEQFDSLNEKFTYHFAVPTISAGVDTPITLNWDWEGREYSTKNLTRTWASDDFTGSDGDPPNPILWTEDGGTSYFKIDSNSLYASGSDMNKILRSTFRVTGNFEIEIDWEALQAPSSDEWRIGFWVTQEGSDGNTDYFSLFRTYNGINRIISNYKDGGIWGSISHYLTEVTSGKFKFVRTGGHIYAYQDALGSYLNIKNYDFGEAPPVQIIIEAVSLTPNYPTIENTWDNFVVNSADGIYLPDEIKDDFTGNDGDAPDVMKWTETDPDNVMSIQSNKLHFDGEGSGNNISMMLSKFELSGNFDVQVDFDLITWDHPTTAPNYVYIRLIDGGTYTYLARQDPEGGTEDRIRLYGNGGTNEIWNWSGTSGKFRFQKTSGGIYAYVWTGSQWEWNGNTSGKAISESYTNAKVFFLFEQETGGDVEATLDNFQINSADSITGWTDNTGNLPAQTVWDSNFKIVTHLAQEPTGSASDILDSTANEFHGTSYNMGAGNSGSNEFGKYLTFDGTEEFIDFGDVFYSDNLTIEATMTPTVVNAYNNIILKRNTVGTVTKLDPPEWEISIQDTGILRAVIWQDNSYFVQVDGTGGDLTSGTESYIAAAFPGNGSGNAVTQVDDSENGSSTHNRTIGNRASGIQIAARSNNLDSRYFEGDIREVRLSNTFRSEAWRTVTHYSLNGQIWVPLEEPSAWDLVIQDMTVATSTDQISLIVSLIIQNLNILTSAEVTKIIPLLNINDLDINTDVGRMKFWEALSTINNSIEFRTLLRTILSRTPKYTLESRTLERTLKQING